MPSEASNVLSAVRLCKSYGSEVVLRDVSLSLGRGERVAITGPSGSGKSTLLNCLTGIEPVSSGEIRICGNPMSLAGEDEWSRLRRSTFGYVFQFFQLLPTLSVEENIAFPLMLLGWPLAKRRDRVRELLEETALTHRATAFPESLSGGEKQRVSLARACVHRPAILFADEPTGSLDSRNGTRVLALLNDLSSRYGTSVLMVTHDSVAAKSCDRQVAICDGMIEESGRYA